MKLPFAFARRFVAGENFKEAVPKVTGLNNLNIKVTLDLLGENVHDRKTADQTLNDYIDLLGKIHDLGLDASISVKLTMMGLDIDSEYTRDNLFKLLEAARHKNQFVRIDMEGSDYVARTIDIYKEAFAEFGKHVGIVLQAYLHRTRDDVAELADVGADVRMVKGAYKESERIALQNMPAIRDAFKEYTAVLLEKTPYPRIATHDDELVNWTKEYAQQNHIGQARYEFQMLYGLRQTTCEELVKNGYNVRIYVPYGTMWFPYFSRRLKERKENIWFVLYNLLRK
ncbi:MAG TPA: proline dehydrogenase family protein [Balneolales bacterium]|nr:proline dehydrogenase family protein [Balneolales bacterium]